MSKEINDIIKEVVKQTQDLEKSDNKLNSDVSDISREIKSIKKDIKKMSEKIDDILDLLNTLTIFIEDNENIIDEDELENTDSNEGWLPEITEWEHNYNSDDIEDED
jgi:uncharacterized coiled-coil DUF342 family protein